MIDKKSKIKLLIYWNTLFTVMYIAMDILKYRLQKDYHKLLAITCIFVNIQ